MRLRALAFALVVLCWAAAAEADDRAGWSYRLAHDIMSPYCPGLSLSDCPSPNAAELREWIIAQEEAGASRDAVEEQLLARFGDQLLQAPRPEGVGLLAYAIPLAVFGLGAVLVALILSRRGRAGARETTAAVAPALSTAGSPRTADADLERVIDLEIGD